MQRRRTSSHSAASPGVELAELDAAVARVMEAVSRDSRRAAGIAEEAALLAGAIGTDEAIGRARLAGGWASAATSDFAGALGPAREAARVFRALGDDSRFADASIVLGMCHLRLGRLDEARQHYTEALEASRRAGDRLHESDALSSLGAHATMIGEYDVALELGHEALAIATELNSDARLADAHTGIGNTLVRRGDYERALEHLEIALECARRCGEIRLEGYALGNIGSILERTGDPSAALRYQLLSLECSEKLGDRWGINGMLNNVAIVYQRLGKYATALDHLMRALELAQEIGEPDGECAALANIGMLFEAIGEHDRVLEYFERSHAIAERTGDRHATANTLILLGRYHSRTGDAKLALLSLVRALRLHEEMGNRYGQLGALYNMGQTLLRVGDHPAALQRLEEALELARVGGDRLSGILVSIALARSLSETGDHEAALAHLERSLAEARDAGAEELALRSLDALTEIHRAAGRRSDAAASAATAGELLQIIFDRSEAHRIGELVTRLERQSARRHARHLGIDAADLEEISRTLDRARARVAATQANAPAAAARVTVVTFGELRVSVGERDVSLGDWGRKRARDLFKLLLLHHRRSLSLDRIVEQLGGEIGDRGAEMVVMNAVSHVRRTLEPAKPSRERTTYLRHADGAYILDLGDDAHIDFLRFKELVAQARRATSAAERRGFYEQAIELYHDDFLKEDLDAEWTESERSMLRDARLEALEFVAAEQLRQERVEEAITTARSILGEDNTSELAHEILLQALVQRGRHGEARAAVVAMTRAFHDELGVQPPQHLLRMLDATHS